MSDVDRTAAPRQPAGSVGPRLPRGSGKLGKGSTDLTPAQRNALAGLLRVSPVADELGRRFARAGHELHLVGGSVRDALLGRLGDDLDFATDAHPDQTLAVLNGWAEAIWETGREFGTIGAQREGLRLEITTFRAESYDGVSRNPVVRYGDSLIDDLRRRDFTVNAMAVSLPGHDVHRPVRRAGRPRRAASSVPRARPRSRSATTRCGCCGRRGSPPSSRFTVAPDVRRGDDRRWPPTCAGSPPSGSATSSRKLLCGADPVTGLRLLVDTGLADVFLPELPGLQLEIDEHAQHKDVYEHTLTVVRNAIASGARTAAGPRAAAGRAACTTSASRRPRRSAPTAGSASTTTRWSARG